MAPHTNNKKKTKVQKLVTRAKHVSRLSGPGGRSMLRLNGVVTDGYLRLDPYAGRNFQATAVTQFQSAADAAKQETKYGLELEMLVGTKKSEKQAKSTAGGFVKPKSEESTFGIDACLEMLNEPDSPSSSGPSGTGDAGDSGGSGGVASA